MGVNELKKKLAALGVLDVFYGEGTPPPGYDGFFYHKEGGMYSLMYSDYGRSSRRGRYSSLGELHEAVFTMVSSWFKIESP